MEYNLRYLPLAKQDIDAIDKYLSGFYSSTAGKFFSELQRQLQTLKSNPEIGEPYQRYRRLVVQKYLVFYMVNHDDRVIDIYRILRGAYDIEKHIAKE